jgi:hypothetical protein
MKIFGNNSLRLPVILSVLAMLFLFFFLLFGNRRILRTNEEGIQVNAEWVKRNDSVHAKSLISDSIIIMRLLEQNRLLLVQDSILLSTH